MANAIDRFMKYITFDTQSVENSPHFPSSPGQTELAKQLVADMLEIGIRDAHMDELSYVYGTIPANEENLPALGFIAHLDTSPDASGRDVMARIVEDYDGTDIYLNSNASIPVDMFPKLLDYVGQDIIVTDGMTLLGSDDKAGIAEILTMADTLINGDRHIKHGKICIAFTPDEEVGTSTEHFDIEGFGADFAYTVDGSSLGKLEYENFNAATANVTINGRGIHCGYAKDKMLNAISVAQEFDAMLPAGQRPEYTEGYDGFVFLSNMVGEMSHTEMTYLIRDHAMNKFEQKKAVMRMAAEFLNKKYGYKTVQLTIRDQYYNMKEKILPHFHLVETAKEAMLSLDIKPDMEPVRGGTDGATLSFRGLPCPNLCTGGHNLHGTQEYIPVQSIYKVCDLLIKIVELTYEKFAK